MNDPVCDALKHGIPAQETAVAPLSTVNDGLAV